MVGEQLLLSVAMYRLPFWTIARSSQVWPMKEPSWAIRAPPKPLWFGAAEAGIRMEPPAGWALVGATEVVGGLLPAVAVSGSD